ncbi:MAG: glycerol-3-phosphate 1-O-acyltransferase PlsY [Clostridia bacterium]|nr:glycerol-3-phosphate 1-O-acyltransferase PlsY [Clostridia bacterium]
MALSECWWILAIVAVASYLFGNINTAIIISKLLKKDIRTQGSGNPGTMNMSRVFGLKIGALVLLLDILKGVLPTLIAGFIFGDKTFEGTSLPITLICRYTAGFFVILGHIFPVFYKFKGGKGIASTIGVFLVAEWYVALIFGVVALAFIFITRIGSMGSFLATTPPAIYACIDIYNTYYKPQTEVANQHLAYFIVVDLLILGIVFLTWFAHRQNIERLLSGDEHPTNWLQMIKDLKLKRKIKPAEQNAEPTDKASSADKTDGDKGGNS